MNIRILINLLNKNAMTRLRKISYQPISTIEFKTAVVFIFMKLITNQPEFYKFFWRFRASMQD